MRDTLPLPFYFRYFPTMKLVVLCVSDWLSQNWFSMGFIDMRKELSSQIDTILVDPTVLQSAEHETIFDHLVTPPSVGDQHFLLDKNRLLNEATNLIFAGSDTVASTCKVRCDNIFRVRPLIPAARLVRFTC
jgi:hypothetical protein